MPFISNLVGFTKKSDLAKLGKSDTLNMFVTTTDSNEHSFQRILRPMPGYSQITTVTGDPQGTYRISRDRNGKPAVYGVWNKKLYLVENNSLVWIADIATSNKCQFVETSGYGHTAPHLVICDGQNVYAVDTTLSISQQRDDFRTILLPLEYPDKTTRITPSWIAYLYGYLIVGAKNTDIFYRSYQYPFENEISEGVINYDIFMADTGNEDTKGYGKWTMSEWQPDNTITGCATGSRLFTFGERSFQIFTWQDSITTPFTSPDTGSQSIGIKNANSLASYANYVFWLGSADHGNGVVYMMGGDANPQRISTDEIEEMISGYDMTSINSFVFRYRGHPFYVINFTANGITLVYDVREQGWTRMSSRNNLGNQVCFRYSSPSYLENGDLIFQCTGALVKATETKWTEHDSTPILRQRVGGMLCSDHKVFKVQSLKLLTNNGEYPNIGTNNATVKFRFCRNGVTWEEDETQSMGSDGEYDYDVVLKNLGKALYFTVEVSCSDDVPFALYGMDVKATTCACRY